MGFFRSLIAIPLVQIWEICPWGAANGELPLKGVRIQWRRLLPTCHPPKPNSPSVLSSSAQKLLLSNSKPPFFHLSVSSCHPIQTYIAGSESGSGVALHPGPTVSWIGSSLWAALCMLIQGDHLSGFPRLLLQNSSRLRGVGKPPCLFRIPAQQPFKRSCKPFKCLQEQLKCLRVHFKLLRKKGESRQV